MQGEYSNQSNKNNKKIEAYVSAAIKGACDDIAGAQPGSQNVTLNSAAYGIGQLVGAGAIDFNAAALALTLAATDAGMDRAEVIDTVKSGLRGGAKKPRDLSGIEGGDSLSKPKITNQQQSDAERKSRYAARLYREAGPIAGTVVERYLREVRGIDLKSLPKNIRCHPGVKNSGSGKVFPAMIAPIVNTGAASASIKSVHVTWLDPNTSYKTGSPSKQIYGGCIGGGVWLGDYASHMLIAEGIEKTLACMEATGIPSVVGVSSTILPSLVWPRGTRRVTICADPNPAGEQAINKAASAWIADGIDVTVCYPPIPNKDWDECDPDNIAAAILSATEWRAPETSFQKESGNSEIIEKQTIKIRGGELHNSAKEAMNIIVKAGVNIFQNAGKLVRPEREEATDVRGRSTFHTVLRDVDATYLILLANHYITWKKWDERLKADENGEKWKVVDTPDNVARIIMSASDQWPFRSISGVISTPTLRYDGSLLDKNGYDSKTHMFLDSSVNLPDMKEHPDKIDAEISAHRLEELISEFPFTDDASVSVALSAIITPVVRGMMSTSPAHGATAPTAGTGKSYLFDIASAIATGKPSPVISSAGNDEETEKRIVAKAMSGETIIHIDNVNGTLGGDVLCQLIVQETCALRVLGKSEHRLVSNRHVIFFNGNNVVVRDDMTRRAILATLDAKVERPEHRSFKIDPMTMISKNRGKYVADCITILRAYMAAGRPKVCETPMASFGDWTNSVRSALVWLGYADPCTTMQSAREGDPTLQQISLFLAAAAGIVGKQPTGAKSVGSIIKVAEQPGIGGGYAYPDLHDFLEEFKGFGGVSAKRLGRWLARHSNRVVDGKRIASVRDNKKKQMNWYIEDVG